MRVTKKGERAMQPESANFVERATREESTKVNERATAIESAT